MISHGLLVQLLLSLLLMAGVALNEQPCDGSCPEQNECDVIANLCRNVITFDPSCEYDCPEGAVCDATANKCQWVPGNEDHNKTIRS